MSLRVSPEERVRLQDELTEAIWRLEQRKADPKPFAEVKHGVGQYLESTDKKSKSADDFRGKIREKIRTALAELDKTAKPSAPVDSIAQAAQTSTRAPPVQQQKVMTRPPAEVAQARSQPPGHAPPQQSVRPSLVTARPLVTGPSRPSAAQVGRLRKLEDLRGPLEKCRAMLRVQAVFGISKGDSQSKEVFMRVFNSTRETIGKSKSMTAEEMDQFVRSQLEKLDALDRSIRPRMESHAQNLKLGSLDELFEMELEPMMLLDRYLHVHGNVGSLQKKLDTCVDAIGSNYKAKKLRSHFEHKPY